MLLRALRALLVAVVFSAAGALAYLGSEIHRGNGPAGAELAFWVGSQLGFAALAVLLLATVARRRAR